MTLLFTSLILVLTACNNDAPKESSTEDSKPPLRISILLPLTGPGAGGAIFSQEGFDLALNEIQANGGKVDISFEDTQTNPKTAVSILQRLQASSSPPNVIVPQLSSVMKAIQPILKDNMLTVATGVSIPDVADSSKNRFRIFLSSTGMGETAAGLVNKSKVTKPCVVYVNDEYGQSCLLNFTKAFEGKETVISEPFSLLEKDFRSQWQKIISKNVDCVFVVGYGPGYLTVLKQMREQGYNGMVITDWSITSPGYSKAVAGVLNGAYVVSVRVPQSFIDQYQKTYNKDGSYINAGYSYDTLKTIWYAYSNSDGSIKGMTQALTNMKNYPGIMDTKGIQQNGDMDVRYSIFKIQDGQLVDSGE